MILAIASGKGGTGKTTLATNLAATLYSEGRRVCLLDTDVEAPNVHLFCKPQKLQTTPVALAVPRILADRCTLCGRCAEVCRFNAIGVFGKGVLVFPELCHACGGCSLACPEGAIVEESHHTGVIKQGDWNGLPIIWGELIIGEAKAPPIIKEVRKAAPAADIIIIDAPPGTSCPVVTALRDTDFVVLVTEPTPFGLHDLKLAVATVRQLSRRFGVVINRADIGDDRVIRYCQEEGIQILLQIPEDRAIADAYAQGKLIIETKPLYRDLFLQLLGAIT